MSKLLDKDVLLLFSQFGKGFDQKYLTESLLDRSLEIQRENEIEVNLGAVVLVCKRSLQSNSQRGLEIPQHYESDRWTIWWEYATTT